MAAPQCHEIVSHTSEELSSHLGQCWATPAGAAPKGVIIPVLRNGVRGKRAGNRLKAGENCNFCLCRACTATKALLAYTEIPEAFSRLGFSVKMMSPALS